MSKWHSRIIRFTISLHFCLEGLIAWAGTTSSLDANFAASLCGSPFIYMPLGAGRVDPKRNSPSLALGLGAIPTLIRVQHNQPCAVPSGLTLIVASILALGTGWISPRCLSPAYICIHVPLRDHVDAPNASLNPRRQRSSPELRYFTRSRSNPSAGTKQILRNSGV